MANLALPGNPRYQPKDLIRDFGYDNLARPLVEVEFAALDTLAEFGVIPEKDWLLITDELRQKILAITTSEMDKIEREITKHDIRALVRLMQDLLPQSLRRWVHVPLTSYDVIDTARMLQFTRVHEQILRRKIKTLVCALQNQARTHADVRQIGRTHGQHALPITVGFWFANILSRVLYSANQMDAYASGLVGKISGAVGAYNAQVGLGIDARSNFEQRVLQRLHLSTAPISTQILPPEPLAYYLFSAVALSGACAQLADDARHLMRTEIGEITEPFVKGQVGSSTMAHKRNPVSFEGVVSAWKKNKAEMQKVLENMLSEHQRDLTGSALSRDFPTIIVNLTTQLDTLLRGDKDDARPFIERIRVNVEACERNLAMQGDVILAEPLYLALQMYGYKGDAHEVINHEAMKMVSDDLTLVEAVEKLAIGDDEIASALNNIPVELHALFREPGNYNGKAAAKVQEICELADAYPVSWT